MPSDPMYSSINGYYLRLGDNSGAFKDIGALPGFGAFFCGGGGEGRSRVERMWITKIICDGMIDGWNFNCVTRRHAIPLIMGYADSLVSDGEEKVLLLGTLGRLCEVKPRGMIEGRGYLGWLNCLDVEGEFCGGRVGKVVVACVEKGLEFEEKIFGGNYGEEEGGGGEGRKRLRRELKEKVDAIKKRLG